MSKAGRISYNFVQGTSLEELELRGKPWRENGWNRVGEPRSFEVRIPGRGRMVCYSQTFSRVTLPPRCGKVAPANVAMACRPLTPCDHFVQIYETDSALLDQLEVFIGDALNTGDSAVVIATPAHVTQLDQRLDAAGFDVERMRIGGSYITLDAAQLIDRFMVDGFPDEKLFRATIDPVLAAARRGGNQVRAFGEMVALLWAEGKQAAALKLEELWHPVCETEQFPLFCAYPKSGFLSDNFGQLAAVCAAHSRVF